MGSLLSFGLVIALACKGIPASRQPSAANKVLMCT